MPPKDEARPLGWGGGVGNMEVKDKCPNPVLGCTSSPFLII